MKTPILSVVMPVHDGAKWIRATLESVAAEPSDDLDVIIIDSSPDEETAAIVREFEGRIPFRLLRRPHITPWQNKTNLGVELAEAEHVCMLHQDDLWRSGRVSAVRSWLAANPEAVLHLAPSLLIDRSGDQIGRWTCPLPSEQRLNPEFLHKRLLVQNFVSVPAPVFKRQAWIDVGGMDEALWYTPDWDIWLKLCEAGPTIYHSDATTSFRLHASSLTVTGSRDAAEFRAQMETVLTRHLPRLEGSDRRGVERISRASIEMNVSLAAAASGASPKSLRALSRAGLKVLALGPLGVARYLRDSRLSERLLPRVRAKLSGAF